METELKALLIMYGYISNGMIKKLEDDHIESMGDALFSVIQLLAEREGIDLVTLIQDDKN